MIYSIIESDGGDKNRNISTTTTTFNKYNILKLHDLQI